jgi:phage terminase large subunit-like protein
VIERAANGDRLAGEMSRKRDLKIIAVQPDQRSKAARLAEQIDVIKSGRLHLPAQAEFVDAYVAEFTALRRQHWDQVDATVQYLDFMQTGSKLRLPRERGVAYVVNEHGPVPIPNTPARFFSRHKP